ncbi:MAG: SusC/RagA family TonB-linked outer membrane protein [Lutibacter sp.]|nr:SusC/RagA family TonB-linked outer membrane protein [Lutibacter sp.]
MKTKLNGFLTLLLALMVQISFAQEKTVTGKVSDASGPLPGVTVLIKGTKTGTQTDFDGNYSTIANIGDVLQFSFMGMQTVEKTVGSTNVLNVVMQENAQALEEVVVTGLGIKREKQALGYAVSNVSSEDIEQKPESDIARVLSGKASGVQITQQSGMSGSGTSIIIRGMNSFSGSNQPLFIVDGVPFSSDTNEQGSFVDGNNGSSRFLDLDPNNIESVSVLKGLAAATLYGTEGRNGVILVNTKSGTAKGGGSKKTEITVTSSLFANEIASMPKFQNEYGGGFDQAFGWFFSNWGPSFDRDGPAGWGNQSSIDENGTLAHPYSTANAATGVPAAFPEFAGARYDWKPYDGVKDFFRTGVIKSNGINIRGSSADGDVGYNVSFGNLDDQGFTPGNQLRRNTFSIGGTAKLSNKFTVNGTMNYTRTDFKSPPVAAGYGSNVGGSNASIFGNIFYTPRSVDLMGLPYQNPVTGGSVYYRQSNDIQHPLWTVANAGNTQNTHRVFGGLSLLYELNDNLNISYRYGFDVYSENNSNYSNKGGKTGSAANISGVYQTWNNTNTIDDHNFTLNGNYDINEDIDLSFSIGATSRSDVYDSNGVGSVGQQVFGVLRHFNFAEQDEIEYFQERNILGAYAQTEIGYQDFIYLTLAGRNDWVSNLAEANRSITYPSASVSFLPTKIIESLKESEVINYLKLRAGYGTSANFPTGYPISSTLILDTQNFQDSNGVNVVTNTSGTSLGNVNLKPETIAELEFGIESRMLNNRLTLDASIYSRKTKDLIVDRPLDPSTGYTTTRTNVGEVKNDGIEIDLGYDWLRSDNNGLNWTTNVNWSKNEAIVTDLGLDTDIVVYSGFTNLGNAAIKGEPLGTMIGSAIARDDNGNFKVNAAGDYVVQNGNNIIGNATPDFTMNVANSISYKNFSLGFLVSWVEGGDMLSYTVGTLLGRGVVSDGVDRENSFILPGVNPAGEPNTTQINNSTYYFGNVLYGPSEMLVYDATVVRLQELSFGYKLPSKYLDKTPFGSLSLTFTGNNLWFYTPNIPKNTNFDPNVAGLGVGNGAGFEYLNGPSSRRYGVSVKASF